MDALATMMARDDPESAEAARQAANIVFDTRRGVIESAARSDATFTLQRLVVEGYAAAGAARAAIGAGDSPDGVFNEQIAIAQEHGLAGVPKGSVVALMMVRCLAIGYMFERHRPGRDADRFETLFLDFIKPTGDDLEPGA